MDRIGKVSLLRDQKDNREEKTPSITEMCDLLDVPRTTIYNEISATSEQEIAIKRRIDEIHNSEPTWGARMMSKSLQREGYAIGRYKTRRYMTEMGNDAIYPKPNTSCPNKQHKKYPYLLKNLPITRANQVWAIDITYIRLGRGFCYLTAIIDWYSRCIVGYELDDTLSTRAVTKALNKAFAMYGAPEIINSDQGCQFTSQEYISLIESNQKTKISMDGKGRWADNIIIERWFRTLKCDEVYLKDYQNIKEARREISAYIHRYNFIRPHSSLQYKTPAEAFFPRTETAANL